MDNGNKIKINKPEVKLFLHGDLLPANAVAPVKYNLVEEYAKTKSKKVSFIFVVLALCVVIVSALTVGLVRFLQERNNSLEVDINVFDDLNLKNLLDVVSRTQASLDQASQEKNQLELELSTKLSQAELKRDSELQLLNSLNSSDVTKREERTAIYQEYESSVAALNSEYQPKIALLEAQMEDYTAQLASFDSTNVEMAQEQEAAINSQRQAFELEKQELVANYDKLVADLVAELEALQAMQLETQAQALTVLSEQHQEEINIFDPVFSDERANAIVNSFQNSENIVSDSIDASLSQESSVVLSNDVLQGSVEEMLLSIENAYSDFNHVANITSSVPWSNSLKEYIQTLSRMANQIGDDILSSSVEIFLEQEEVLKETQLELVAKEQEVAQMLLESEGQMLQLASLQSSFDALQVEFAVVQEKILSYEENVLAYEERILSYEEIMHNYEARVLDYEEIVSAFDERAKQNGDAGYILNVSDQENIRVYISSLFEDSVQEGARAFVLRSGTLLGMVSLSRKGNIFYATPDEGVGELLRVNDVLLLELVE